jgi:hypothetical protein
MATPEAAQGNQPLLTWKVTTAQDTVAKAFITAAGAYADAVTNLGVTRWDAASGKVADVIIYGIATVLCGGTVTAAGDRVEVYGGTGGVQTQSSGVCVGKALQSGASGDEIQILVHAH